MMHGNGMINGWMTMGPLMWIFMILFWGLAIFGLICAVRWMAGHGTSNEGESSPQTPLEILKARYAKGEIDRDQFERIKKDLE